MDYHLLWRVSIYQHLPLQIFGSSDVYSYPEDDSVLDPLLAQHLAHFGIDFSSMQKVSNGWCLVLLNYKGEDCILSDTLLLFVP